MKIQAPQPMVVSQGYSIRPQALFVLIGLCSLTSSAAFAGDWFSLKDGDNFKRFSASAGFLVASPQGDPNPISTRTAIPEGFQTTNGPITVDGIVGAVDTTQPGAELQQSLLQTAAAVDAPLALVGAGLFTFFRDDVQYFNSTAAGTVVVNGVENFQSPGTGVTVDTIKTLGLTFDYHFTDNVAMQIIGGFPPKADISGQGQVVVPISGVASPEGIAGIVGDIPIQQDLFITDLASVKTLATARAWTPAVELQYQWGKTGVNKFRPYIGAGVMYSYFNELELNDQIERDLKAGGDLVQNVLEGNAGQAIDGLPSTARSKVELEASDGFSPIVSLGATYDFNENWYGVASVSYADLSSDVTISVMNENTGTKLYESKTELEVNPILSYVGVGYRF